MHALTHRISMLLRPKAVKHACSDPSSTSESVMPQVLRFLTKATHPNVPKHMR